MVLCISFKNFIVLVHVCGTFITDSRDMYKTHLISFHVFFLFLSSPSLVHFPFAKELSSYFLLFIVVFDLFILWVSHIRATM